ncbi:hypothetical protein N9L66_05105 [Porticoccaceae bacterium]|nr:hypothetical protein [Porticoccaceae bacterium]
MLNKKLIAGSVLAVVSASASAVPTFTYTADSVSKQGAASLADLTLPEVVITSGAEYSDDDLIVIDYNVPLASGYTPASTLAMYASCMDGDTTPALQTGTATENGGELTLGLLSTDAAAGSVTYRVTNVDYTVATAGGGGATDCVTSNDSSVGAVVSLGATVEVDAQAALAAGSVTGTYHATLPNGLTDIDGGSIAIAFVVGSGATAVTTSAMASFVDQFSDADGTGATTANTDLSGEIDVTVTAAPRSEFTYAAPTANDQVDQGVVTLLNDTSLDQPATPTGITFTLAGDFSFLVDSDDTTAGIQNSAFSINLDPGTGADDFSPTTITTSAITWTVTEDNAGTPVALTQIDDITVDFDNAVNGDGTVAMEDGEFEYTVSIAYEDTGTDGAGTDKAADSVPLTTGADFGEWTLNGSETIVSNYPLSDAVVQFVWVTNTGSQDAGIYAEAIGGTGAQTMASCYIGDSLQGQIERITDELNTCLAAAGMTAGRAEVTITVNAASTDIGVYAGYKHIEDADRLNLTQ